MLRKFIRENRAEIDAYIHSIAPGISLNDADRAEWITNDESLYNWARSAGAIGGGEPLRLGW